MPESYFVRENAAFAPRRTLIRIKPDTWAVIDTATGGFYGLVEHTGRPGRTADGARDWEGLSLNVPPSNHHVADTTPAAWANRLVYRADKAGGLPVYEDPELTPGLFGEFLYLPGGQTRRRFNAYTSAGQYLGSLERVGTGLWQAACRKTPQDAMQAFTQKPTREQAATALLEKSKSTEE
jgi:hypothetical protein